MKSWTLMLVLVLTACGDSGDVYSLYRTSIVGGSGVHIATFDADEPGNYNQRNCIDIANFLTSANVGPEGVVVSYYCSIGRAD